MPNTDRGGFITLEGGEGSGKSTQISSLVERLGNAGIEVLATREPGGSPGAETIRRLLVEGAVDKWQPLTECLLHFAARNEHWQRTIKPALEGGIWVVSDRFTDSTLAYQGYVQGVDRDIIASLEDMVLGGRRPGLTLVLDIDPEVGLARATGAEDRYERMGIDFHRTLRQAFQRIAADNPERCLLIDAGRAPGAVANTIWDAVLSRWPELA